MVFHVRFINKHSHVFPCLFRFYQPGTDLFHSQKLRDLEPTFHTKHMTYNLTNYTGKGESTRTTEQYKLNNTNKDEDKC